MSRPTVARLQADVAELHALVADLAAQITDLRTALGTEVRTRRLVVVDQQQRERIIATTQDVADDGVSSWASLEVNDGTHDHSCMCVSIEVVEIDMASDPPSGVASVSLTSRGNRVGEMSAISSDSKPTTADLWFDPAADRP